jgi:hypothetical protein
MKKLSYLIVLTLILGLVLTGCLLSNVGQVPTNEQSRTSGVTIVINGCDTGVADILYNDKLISVRIEEIYYAAKNHGQFVRGVALLTNDLMKAGIITGKEKGKIQSCAAKSEVFPETAPLAVGDSYGGGIVAYILQPGESNGVYNYDENVQHGLIAAIADATSIMPWSNITGTLIGTTGTALGTGKANTTAIAGQAGCTSGAAYYCDNLIIDIYDDWFLPSKDELDKLYFNKDPIGGFADSSYWSSSEFSTSYAWYQVFLNGNKVYYNKNYLRRVRAVRAF